MSLPATMTMCLSLSTYLSVQWLESIEMTKSALQQKMLDIESEKVKDVYWLQLPLLFICDL